MEKFREIKQNKYTGVNKPFGKTASGCACLEQCDEMCRNMAMSIECGPSCKFGDNCLNKRFQQRRYARISTFETSDGRGKGVRTEELINKHQFIVEYVGEVICREEMVKRMNDYNEVGMNHHYIMALGSGLYIDATKMGNVARFINHSCSPNCEVEFWDVNNRECVGIFAKREIQQGEELTYDYQFETFGSVEKLFGIFIR